ncbi:response regulator [Pseudomonas sp. KU43P]|uniref:response regulator n=1 Tax=Pseudomonas sp. KU43P TaxID=2487887 RepID=UPI002954CB1F|nr:response regulator [Pseudomonas sp. KU43P]
MGELIAAHDWWQTALGPLPLWQAPLRLAVDAMLMSPFPSAVVWGPELTVIHNSEYQRLLEGMNHALGKGFDALWASNWEEVGPWVYKALQGHASFVEDQPLWIARANSDSKAWYAFSYTPICDEQREVAGFLHTVIETTASVEALEKWRDQAQAFEEQIKRYLVDRESMWQLSRDAMITVTRDLKLKAANPAWLRILNWTMAEVHDIPILQLVHPADRAEVEVAVIDFVRDQGADQLETRLRHSDGHYRTFRWTAKFDGTMLTAVGRDITDDREEAMRQAQAMLRDSQQMELVSHLAGGMAHEMNNLLSGIGGSLEMLQRRLIQGRLDRIDNYVELARDSVQRAMTLTHRLLAFSRHQPLSPKPLDINRQLSAMEPLLLQVLGAEMRLHWHKDVHPWAVCLDVAQLESTFVSLCANARDACLGRGNVTVRTTNMRLASAFPDQSGLPPGDYVAVHVSDDGHGMTSEELARACDPFFTTKPVGHGAGLGLSMVHGFVGQSGGYMWLESAPDDGAMVSMLFPRSTETIPEVPPARVPTVMRGEGLRLLLVDDELNLRMLMREYLRERGFEVCDVTDANSALDCFRHNGPFDLVITDIGLPGGFSGRQVARAMRMIKPEQKILFITGYTHTILEPQLFEAPGTELMLKPFPLESLADQALLMLNE